MDFLNKIRNNVLGKPVKCKSTKTLERVEIDDITEKLIARIDNKLKALKAIEARVDQKIVILDGLITQCETMDLPGDSTGATSTSHRYEVQALARKGFKSEQIVQILDLPSGEVELILNLVH
ncbi:MAG: hypothetical protein C0407_00785 [Desulfobacca sp.]|nr:hypothetical protein [Desulfobacca sp.]